ncbi:thioredoxin domain-containing protein [Specibacter sp. RAF43]|uniref:thioredoxin domain-containing protein n=1 Tax=Specibacter sp. RAF43 TaxID=3233057 RepID=UPI003F94B4F3
MNRLAGEPSAYLRQHAGNPVDWQPFDDAAFAEARRRNVPVFLSVGYAACHWCHVMAGESFEDPAIGAYLREHFVAIKVDREERPDVDDAYMAATQALAGQGGWPMSVFLTPAGQAFYAGTYFPPQPSSGRPSFRQVLDAVVEAWTERREDVLATAGAVAAALADPVWRVRTDAGLPGSMAGGSSPVAVSAPERATSLAACAAAAVTALADAEDRVHGGLGRAPKFPPTPALEFLIRHAASAVGESSHTARGLAGRTLGALVNSALFDQVGGGFARYSVTADWSEPHYEKMLYDNAGLLRALVHWVRLADSQPDQPAFTAPAAQEPHTAPPPVPLPAADARRAANATIAWLLAELRLPGGSFASSLDADTVIDGTHYEGASYRWTREEVGRAAAMVGDDTGGAASAVAHAMNIPATGSAPLHPGRALTPDDRAAWELLLPALHELRAGRPMPARDDKVVAAWNGMLLAALAEAAMVLGEPAHLAAAVELGEYLRRVHWDGEVLRRVSHDGVARGIDGLLEDYAACVDGYFALYAATADGQWFAFAQALLGAARRFLGDGTVFNSADAGASLGGAPAGSRYADPFDNATASPVALLAGALVTSAAYTGSTEHRRLADHLVGSLPELTRRAPRAAGGLLAVAQAMMAGPVETAIVGAAGTARGALVRRAWGSPSPGMVISVWDGVGAPPIPLLEGRALADRTRAGASGDSAAAMPLAYVCREMVCARPVAEVRELGDLLP